MRARTRGVVDGAPDRRLPDAVAAPHEAGLPAGRTLEPRATFDPLATFEPRATLFLELFQVPWVPDVPVGPVVPANLISVW